MDYNYESKTVRNNQDWELPFEQMNEKVAKLEQQMQSTLMKDLNVITETVCRKIDGKAARFLPSIMTEVSQIKDIKERVDEITMFNQQKGVLNAEIDLFKLTMSSLKEELGHLQVIQKNKTQYSNKNGNANFDQDSDSLQQQLFNKASLLDIQDINKRLNHYVEKQEFRMLQDDVEGLVKRDEFSLLSEQQQFFEKDIGKLISKEEIIQRLSLLHQALKSEINQKASSDHLMKVLSTYDIRMSNLTAKVNKEVKANSKTLDSYENQIEMIQDKVANIVEQNIENLEKTDTVRIWNHFKKFTEHSDLSQMQSKFTQKMSILEEIIKQNNISSEQSVRRIDEAMKNKADLKLTGKFSSLPFNQNIANIVSPKMQTIKLKKVEMTYLDKCADFANNVSQKNTCIQQNSSTNHSSNCSQKPSSGSQQRNSNTLTIPQIKVTKKNTTKLEQSYFLSQIDCSEPSQISDPVIPHSITMSRSSKSSNQRNILNRSICLDRNVNEKFSTLQFDCLNQSIDFKSRGSDFKKYQANIQERTNDMFLPGIHK